MAARCTLLGERSTSPQDKSFGFGSRAELWRFFASVLTAQGVGRSVETGGVACIPSRAPPTRYT